MCCCQDYAPLIGIEGSLWAPLVMNSISAPRIEGYQNGTLILAHRGLRVGFNM